MRKCLFIFLFVILFLTGPAPGSVAKPAVPESKIQNTGWASCLLDWLVRKDGTVEFRPSDLIQCKKEIKERFWKPEKPEREKF